MSEAIELEQWWADIADELGVQAAYLHVHGMDWRGRTDGNEVVARAVATIARLTAEIATFQAMMLEAERDALAADLAAWKERCVAADRDRNALADQRDSLAASLEEAREERDKLAAEAEAFRTGMGNGVTILPTEWLDKERAELSELRARVERAVAAVVEKRRADIEFTGSTGDGWAREDGWVAGLQEAIDIMAAILAPPEAPTDKGETP